MRIVRGSLVLKGSHTKVCISTYILKSHTSAKLTCPRERHE